MPVIENKLAVHVKNFEENDQLQKFLFLRNYGWNERLQKVIITKPIDEYGNNTCIYFRDYLSMQYPRNIDRQLFFTFTEAAIRGNILLIPFDLSAVAVFLATGKITEVSRKYPNYTNAGTSIVITVPPKKEGEEDEPSVKEIL